MTCDLATRSPERNQFPFGSTGNFLPPVSNAAEAAGGSGSPSLPNRPNLIEPCGTGPTICPREEASAVPHRTPCRAGLISLVVQQALQRRHGRPVALIDASHVACVGGGQSLKQSLHDRVERFKANVTRHRIPLRITAAAATPGKVARFGFDPMARGSCSSSPTNIGKGHGQKVPPGESKSVSR